MRKIGRSLLVLSLLVAAGVGAISVTAPSVSATTNHSITKVQRGAWKHTNPKKLQGTWYVKLAGAKKYAKLKFSKNGLVFEMPSHNGKKVEKVWTASGKKYGIRTNGKNNWSISRMSNGEPYDQPYYSFSYGTKKINGKKYAAVSVTSSSYSVDSYTKKKLSPKISKTAPKDIRGKWYWFGSANKKVVYTISAKKLKIVTYIQGYYIGTETYTAKYSWANHGGYKMTLHDVKSGKKLATWSLRAASPKDKTYGTLSIESSSGDTEWIRASTQPEWY